MGRAEGEVEGHLAQECRRFGFLCFKFLSGVNGVPDRCIVTPVRILFVETKSDVGRPSNQQIIVHKQIQRAGGDVRIINSRTLVDQLMQELAHEVIARRRTNRESTNHHTTKQKEAP